MSYLTTHVDVATYVNMKNLLVILIALSACGDDTAYAPDAAQHAVDAAIDTPAQDASENRGCMGNLPAARTIMINTGDPIPPNLLNELQDVLVGAKRKTFRRPFYPLAIRTTTTGGGSLTGAANPANATYAPTCKIVGGQLSVYFSVPTEEGERLTDFIIDLYGDGTNDPSITIAGFADMNSASAGGFVMNLTNVPAAWTTYTASVVGAGSSILVAPGGFIQGVLSVIEPNLYYGRMIAVFDRP